MKLLIFLFTFVSFSSIQAQSTVKGLALLRDIRFSVNREASGDTMIYEYDRVPDYAFFDTIFYELREGDTATLILQLTDEGGFFNELFDFDVQLIYGTPVSELYNDYPDCNFGMKRLVKIVMADSALLTFCSGGFGVQTHIIKLTKQKTVTGEPESEPVPMDIAVYPNPVTDILHFSVKKSSFFQLVDAEGSVVGEWSAAQGGEFDMSGCETGTYFLHISDGTALETIRIFKVN